MFTTIEMPNLNNLIRRHPRKSGMWISLIYILAWAPYFLTYYPGVVTQDEMLCIRQALGDYPLSNHHPIIFVFYMRAVMKLVGMLGGTVCTGVAVATGIQIIFIALILSYATCFLISRNTKNWFNIGVLAFWAFSPVVAMFSVILSKDTFFTGWMILLVICVYKISVEGYLNGKSFKMPLIFCGLAVMVAMARSNGVFIVAFMLAALSFMVKENRRRIIILSITVLALIGFTKGPVFKIMNIAESPKAEALSIPLQQIGCALAEDGKFNDSDLQYLNEILPLSDWKNSYSVGITDPLKFHENFSSAYLNKTAGHFLEVWARNLIPNFEHYVRAYLGQIRGYWDITYIANVGSTDTADNPYGIVQTDCIEKLSGVSLKPICSLLVLIVRKLPVVNVITNQALLALFYIIAWIMWMKKKEYRIAITILPFLFQWLTLLIAAPASSEIRYMVSFHFMLPFVIGMFFFSKKRISERSKEKI